jgi:putative transposase
MEGTSMAFDPEWRHRQSIRWQDHDYAAGGTYFVTICTANRVCLFGEVVDGQMRVGPLGQIVDREWMRTGLIRPEVEIDVFGVMPNHLHGLVTIRPRDLEDRLSARSDEGEPVGLRPRVDRRPPLRRAPRSLGGLIAGFKQVTTLAINAARGTPGAPVWQRGYHDRVVRDGEEFDAIAHYIVTNPERWAEDPHRPDR